MTTRRDSFSVWTKLDRFPPIVVRLLASAGNLPLEDEEIAARSGLSLDEVKSVSWRTTWDDVPVGAMRRFTVACGVDFSNRAAMRRWTRYLRRAPRFSHLRRSARWPIFQEMITLFLTTNHATAPASPES